MNAIVLSAGFGTRLQPYTNKCAKPAIPFLGLPLVAYSLFYLERANIKNVVINTHHLPESIKSAVESIKKHLSMHIHYSDEQPIILDSAGGIKQASQYFQNSEPIVVLNGDSLILLNDPEFLLKLIEQHKKLESDITLVTRKEKEAGKNYRAIWANQVHRIQDIAKKEDHTQLPYQFIGIMILSSGIVDKIPFGKSHIFDDHLIPNLKQTRAHVLVHNELTFFETGNEKDFLHAQELCRQKLSENNTDSYWKTLNEILEHFNIDKDVILKSENKIDI